MERLQALKIKKNMKQLIKIKSITDVITNSSTEVFLLKNTNAFKKLNDSLCSLKADYIFDTEEALKEYLSDCYEGNSYKYEYLSNFLDSNPLANYDFVNIVKNELKKSFDEIWGFVKSCYLPLIGYAVITVEDNYLSVSQSLELDRIRDFRTKHGGYVDRI